jgi:hypothetical protein
MWTEGRTDSSELCDVDRETDRQEMSCVMWTEGRTDRSELCDVDRGKERQQ